MSSKPFFALAFRWCFGHDELNQEKFVGYCNGKSGEVRPLVDFQFVEQLQIHIQQLNRIAASNADVIFNQQLQQAIAVD